MGKIEMTDSKSLYVEGEPSHVLENVVLSAYERKIKDGIANPFHDESSLFMFFTAATRDRNFDNVEYHKAYRIVIKDVLDHMERDGVLYCDEEGRYYLEPEVITYLTQHR